MPLACSNCANNAQVSLHTFISTVGIQTRRQKCSKGLLLCHECIQRFVVSEYRSVPASFFERLKSAYTALAELPLTTSQPKSDERTDLADCPANQPERVKVPGRFLPRDLNGQVGQSTKSVHKSGKQIARKGVKTGSGLGRAHATTREARRR
jgi:hypothetical protein